MSTLMEEFLGIWARRARGRRTINTGQLRAWHPDSGKVEVLVDGLLIPDGVKSSAHEDFVAVNEFPAFRVTRYWLRGPKAGTTDRLIKIP